MSKLNNVNDFFKPRTNTNALGNKKAFVKTEHEFAATATKTLLGNSLPFSELCTVFKECEGTTKRLEITDLLTKYFVHLMQDSPGDLVLAVHLSLGRLGPAYEGIELGLGETLLIKAIANSTGSSSSKIKTLLQEHGDIGLVALQLGSNQRTMFKPKPLTLSSIYRTLREIALSSGSSSVARKLEKVQGLFVACEGIEAKFLFRLLEGKLRIGLAEQSVLAALAHAAASLNGEDCSEFDRVSEIKSVYNSLPDYNLIIPPLIKYGCKNLHVHCHLTPGIPLKPMLAYPTKSIGEVLDRFEDQQFTCEYKYDGERAQIHKLPETGEIRIYSRNSEDMTAKYPDILEKIGLIASKETKSFVLDCEVVAYNEVEGKILPFQILSTRKRKDVNSDNIKVQVCLFAFDLLYLNGESLVETQFFERRTKLHANFNDVKGEFHFAQFSDLSSVDEIQSFLDQAIKDGCEGLMVKTLSEESSYEPSKRSRKWLKVKKDYLSGVGDSLDLTVIGGYIGRGKRTGGYGGYLLACYDPDREEYQAICKIGTGFSEANLEEQSEFFKSHIIPAPKPYYNCTENIKPDHWFEPVQVWEVKAADFSISPIYTAAWGLIGAGKGISLRFPRFIRVRDDKGPEQSSTSDLVASLYNSQSFILNNSNNQDNYDEEY